MERRAKLLGLDAPAKTQVSGADGGAIESVVRIVRLAATPEVHEGEEEDAGA